MKRNRDGTTGKPAARKPGTAAASSLQSNPVPTSQAVSTAEQPSSNSWSRPSMLRRGRNSKGAGGGRNSGQSDDMGQRNSGHPSGQHGDAGLFSDTSNDLSEDQRLYIAAAKWCTPVSTGILSRTDLGTMRAGEIISVLQEVGKVLPYWKGNTEQQLIVIGLLGSIPWQRLQSSAAAAAEEEERVASGEARPSDGTFAGSPAEGGGGRKSGRASGRKSEGNICRNVEEPFMTIANLLVSQRPTFINSIIDIVLKPFSQVTSELSTLKRQKTLAVKMIHSFIAEYPTRKDLLVDCIVKQGLTSCYPLRYCPSAAFHLEYQDMCMLLMFEPDFEARMEEISVKYQSSNKGKLGDSGGAIAVAGGRNSTVLFGGGGGGRFSGGARTSGGGGTVVLPPNVVWQQVKESIFNLLLNKLSEMEASYKETNDISHGQFASNLVYSSQSLAAVLQVMAKAHVVDTERGENPPDLWWPSILSATYKERLVALRGKTVVTHMLVPCILSFVSSQAVLDLLHSITTMVLKESNSMGYAARETVASHLYALHHLVRHVPNIQDWGLIRRLGKWIEAAMKAEESKRSEHSVLTVPAVPSLPSTAAGASKPTKTKPTKAATSAAACTNALSAAQLNTKVELELAALENVPASLVEMVYQQHVGLCELYGMSKEKDVSLEHIELLDRRVKESKTIVLPYDANLFQVYEPEGWDESEDNYSTCSRAMSHDPTGSGAQTMGTRETTNNSGSGLLAPQTPLMFGAQDLGTPAFARTSQGTGSQLKHEASILSVLAIPPRRGGSTTAASPHQTPAVSNLPIPQQLKNNAKATPVAEGLQSTSKLPSLSPITGPMPPTFKQSDFMKQQISSREAQEAQLFQSRGTNNESGVSPVGKQTPKLATVRLSKPPGAVPEEDDKPEAVSLDDDDSIITSSSSDDQSSDESSTSGESESSAESDSEPSTASPVRQPLAAAQDGSCSESSDDDDDDDDDEPGSASNSSSSTGSIPSSQSSSSRTSSEGSSESSSSDEDASNADSESNVGEADDMPLPATRLSAGMLENMGTGSQSSDKSSSSSEDTESTDSSSSSSSNASSASAFQNGVHGAYVHSDGSCSHDGSSAYMESDLE